jgi:hypothetical protein
MSNLFEDTVRINKSRPPLRWVADLFGDVAGWAILRISYLDESKDLGMMYQFYSFVWRMTWPLYNKFGTVYKWDFDMSGDGWNDYDEDGIPYWEKPDFIDAFVWDFEDEETGDAFRVLNKE